MAQALKEKALQVGLLEQEVQQLQLLLALQQALIPNSKVQQLQLLLALQQALIPNSKPVSADTPLLEEDDPEDPQVEDQQEDLEVWVAIHPEHQDLLHQYLPSKMANNPLLEQQTSSLWEDHHKSFLETAFLPTTSSRK